MGCPASSLVIASVDVVRLGSRGGGGVVFAFSWSLFNRGGVWFEMVRVVVGSLSCGVPRADVCVCSPLVRRILQRYGEISGGAARDAGAGPGGSELEENVGDVVASLRGAASAGQVVAGYDRYVGCTDFI